MNSTISHTCHATRVADKITLVDSLLYHETAARLSRVPSLASAHAEASTSARRANILSIIDEALDMISGEEEANDFWGHPSEGVFGNAQ